MRVTIEGSRATPTDRLAPGKRITVEYTDSVRKLIAVGGARVVEFHDDTPAAEVEAPVVEDDDPGISEDVEYVTSAFAGAPSRSASKEAWREFVTRLGIDVDEAWTRSDIIAAYDERDAQ